MTNFLDRLFIKDYESPEKPEVRERYGVFASVLGVVVNIFIATLKLVIGLIVGSIAIVADAVNNYSDAGASIVSYVSFKIAAKPADRDHPFGHARIEYVCSMIVSFLILLVGFELFSESISGFFAPKSQDAEYGIPMYVILCISILFKLFLALYYRRVGKLINSSVVSASSADSIMDSVSTLAVLVASIIIKMTGWYYLDSVVGLGVSLLIFIAGLRILNDTKNSLLGEAPVEDVIDSIKETVSAYKEIVGIHDMMIHNYGPNHYIASFHAEVDGSQDIYMLHDAIDNLEREINQKLGILCTIHMDPIETNNEEVNSLRVMASEVVERLYEGASIHDFRTVIGYTHTNLIFDIALPFEIKDSESEVISSVSDEMKSISDKYFCVITVDRQ